MKKYIKVYLVLLLFSFTTHAKTIQCDIYLRSDKGAKDSEEFRYQVRDEIYQVAQEIRNSKPRFTIPFINWKKKAVLKSEPVLHTLNSLLDSLTGLINKSDREDVKASAEVLQSFTHKLIRRYTQNGISYDWLQKLSFFYALHAEMLTSADGNDYLFKVGRAIDYKEEFEVLFKDHEDIVFSMGIDNYYLNKPDYLISINVNFSRHYSNTDSLIVIPTTKAVDLETLYWLKSRGIGIVRVGTFLDVSPADAFQRGFNSASNYYNKITKDGKVLSNYEDIERLKDFYTEIEERISSISKSKRERLIMLSLAYRFLSSNRLIFDNCGSLENYINDILEEKNLKQKYTSSFQLSSSLAQRLPLEYEVREALVELKTIMLAACK